MSDAPRRPAHTRIGSGHRSPPRGEALGVPASSAQTLEESRSVGGAQGRGRLALGGLTQASRGGAWTSPSKPAPVVTSPWAGRRRVARRSGQRRAGHGRMLAFHTRSSSASAGRVPSMERTRKSGLAQDTAPAGRKSEPRSSWGFRPRCRRDGAGLFSWSVSYPAGRWQKAQSVRRSSMLCDERQVPTASVRLSASGRAAYHSPRPGASSGTVSKRRST